MAEKKPLKTEERASGIVDEFIKSGNSEAFLEDVLLYGCGFSRFSANCRVLFTGFVKRFMKERGVKVVHSPEEAQKRPLKQANRFRLERWYAQKQTDWLCDPAVDVFELAMFGFAGAKEVSDRELVEEFREWAKEQKEAGGEYPKLGGYGETE
jgi:hypothetical protein